MALRISEIKKGELGECWQGKTWIVQMLSVAWEKVGKAEKVRG